MGVWARQGIARTRTPTRAEICARDIGPLYVTRPGAVTSRWGGTLCKRFVLEPNELPNLTGNDSTTEAPNANFGRVVGSRLLPGHPATVAVNQRCKPTRRV